MGKKRRFKRGDENKGSDFGSGFKRPPPGILKPGDKIIYDTRPDPDNFVAPTPPRQLSAEEIADEEAKAAEAAGGIMPVSKPETMGNAAVDNVVALNAQTSDEASEDDEETGEKPVSEEPVQVDFKKKKRVAEIIEELRSDVGLERERRQLRASAWQARDRIYQGLFGKPAYVTPANYGPPSEEVPEDFATRIKEAGNKGDPTQEEQHLAVLAYAPDPSAPYWRYVTAGLATPWVQYEPLQVSGFGCELMVKSPVDSPWAAQFLRTLAFYIFNHAGTLSQGVRLALNNSIDPGMESELRNTFIWYADEAPDTLYELPSGLFGILLAVGMTDDELAFADSVPDYGTWCLQALLRQAGPGQVTDPTRTCVMQMENINSMKMSVRNFADTFRANREGQFTIDDTTFT